jgi:hypothetical protein
MISDRLPANAHRCILVLISVSSVHSCETRQLGQVFTLYQG